MLDLKFINVDFIRNTIMGVATKNQTKGIEKYAVKHTLSNIIVIKFQQNPTSINIRKNV